MRLVLERPTGDAGWPAWSPLGHPIFRRCPCLGPTDSDGPADASKRSLCPLQSPAAPHGMWRSPLKRRVGQTWTALPATSCWRTGRPMPTTLAPSAATRQVLLLPNATTRLPRSIARQAPLRGSNGLHEAWISSGAELGHATSPPRPSCCATTQRALHPPGFFRLWSSPLLCSSSVAMKDGLEEATTPILRLWFGLGCRTETP